MKKIVQMYLFDISGTVTTKDVGCQFNYLVPSLCMLLILSIILSYLCILYILDQLECLNGTGVRIDGITLLFIQGDTLSY